MPFDYGFRPNNRQRIANARAKPIKANKNQSVDGAEGLFLRSGSPQNVYLLPQRQNFSLERCPRPKKICDYPNNDPDKISHPPTASPNFRSTASQIEFATGTAGTAVAHGCAPLPPGHRRRIFFGLADTSDPESFGLGYEEVDGDKVVVQVPVKSFDPN